MMGLGVAIPRKLISEYTKEELTGLYNAGKVLHMKPINIKPKD